MFLTTTLLALSPALPQQETQSRVQRQAYQANEIVMRSYRPRHAHPAALLKAAEQFIGRVIAVADAETGEISRHSNLSLFNDSLLIFDSTENVTRVLEMLGSLDDVATAEVEERQRDRAKAAAEQEIQIFEYRPRYVSLYALRFALNGFPNEVSVGGMRTGLDFVDDRGVVVIRETPQKLATIRAFLAEFDTPRPQAQFTCWLVRPTDDPPEGPALPDELLQGLRQLIGGGGLEARSMAFLRSSVDAQQLSIRLDTDDVSYDLALAPTSYDNDQRVLSLGAQLIRLGPQDTTQFNTHTAIRDGEYTVLGATGSTPVFLVVHYRVL